MPDQDLKLTRFEAEPLHSESYLYGIDFTFAYDVGSIGDPSNHFQYGGRLRVGGALQESEDIEGVVVTYWASKLFPALNGLSVKGQFVIQSLDREKLEAKAEMAVEKLRAKESIKAMESLAYFDPGDLYGRE